MPDQLITPQPEAIKPFSAELRQNLIDYRDRNELSLRELATELGTNQTQVSRYLNGKPTGNVVALEGLIEDILENEKRRASATSQIFCTEISSKIANTLDLIRETNDVALISAPAGVGKTCGIELYCQANKAAIRVTVSTWMCGAISSLLAAAVSTRSRPTTMSTGEWLKTKLAGSNRLIIVDNAHKLSRYSLAWLFDFSDETQCPIAFVGNPELLDRIRTNDQWFSRVGINQALRLSPSKSRAVVLQMISQYLPPDAVEEIIDLAEVVAEEHGHFRALRKQCILASRLKEKHPREAKTWSVAFELAHKKLIRNYTLSGPVADPSSDQN